MRSYAVIVPLLFTGIASAADLRAGTVDCEPQRPRGAKTYWSYRVVDGQTCWYAGRPGKSKTELRWIPAVSSVEGRSRTVVSPPDDPGAPSLANTCCWPPLEAEPAPPPQGRVEDAKPDTMTVPPPRTFSQTWNDLLSDMAMPVTRWRAPLKDQQRYLGLGE